MKIIKTLFALAYLLIMLGCGSTSPNQEEQANVASTNDVKTQGLSEEEVRSFEHQLLMSNYELERTLRDKDWQAVSKIIGDKSISEQFNARYPSEFASVSKRYAIASQIKKTLLDLLKNHANFVGGGLYYLYSEPATESSYISHYVADVGDAGYVYLDMHWDKETLTIFDIDNLMTNASTMEFLANFSIFYDSLAIREDLKSNKQNIEKVISLLIKDDVKSAHELWSALPRMVRADASFLDFVSRKLAASQSLDARPYMKDIVTIYGSLNNVPSSYEGYFVQSEDYKSAMKVLRNLNLSAYQDVKIQNEMAMLYALDENYEQAIHHSHQAILSAPYDPEAYFVLLQITLFAQDYDTALKVLDLLKTRFEVEHVELALSELEAYQPFLESDKFKSWISKDG